MTAATADPVSVPLPSPATMARNRAAIRVWLWLMAALVVLMVVVGGATRLTESGLSITEWNPVTGIVPPMSDEAWEEAFAAYREIPQFQLYPDMTMAEFKSIYWWEFGHRLLGRLIGFAFALPLLWFLVRRQVERRLVAPLVTLFVLGGLQGVVGWWMVASGLTERTDVSQIRLAVHLTLAAFILAAIVWVAESIRPARGPAAGRPERAVAGLVVGLMLVQVFAGALVAGLNAALVGFTPMQTGLVRPWAEEFYDHPVAVIMAHRLLAYAVLAVVVVHLVQVWRSGSAVAGRAALLVAAVLVQAGLGIATLVAAPRQGGIPFDLALAHQGWAVVILALAVMHWRRLSPPLPATASQPVDEVRSG